MIPAIYALTEAPIAVLLDADDTYIDSGIGLLLQDPDARLIYLVTLTPTRISSEGSTPFPAPIASIPIASIEDDTPAAEEESVIVYMANEAFTTEPDDAPPNQLFSPRLSQPYLAESRISAPGSFGGSRGSVSVGVEAKIGDGEMYAALLSSSFRGQPLLIQLGGTLFEGTADERVLTFAEFETLFNGFVGDFSWDTETLTLGGIDKSTFLDEPLQATAYAGTGGLEGGDDTKGLPKPLAFGRIFNAAPVLVDAANLIYQLNDGQIEQVDAVRDKGIALAFDADVTDITTATPAAGEYATSLATGYIMLGSSPDGQVTVDFRGDNGGVGYKDVPAELVDKILRDFAEYLDADIDSAAIARVALSSPYPAGYYTGTEAVNVSDVISAIMGSVDGWWRHLDVGLLTVGEYKAPENGIIDTVITDLNIVNGSFRKLQDDGPIYRVRVGYGKNWSPQNKDALAAAVTAANRTLYGEEYRFEEVNYSTTKNIFPKARDVALETLLAVQADAATLASALSVKYRGRRHVFSIATKGMAYRLSIGGIVNVQSGIIGIDKNYFVFGIQEDAAAETTTIWLWG